MPGLFEYKLLPKYPHMKPADVLIWERFIKTNPDEYTSVDYDVLVGTGRRHEGAAEPELVDGFEILTKKKIDVVGYRGGFAHIIEIKPNAGPSALGQVISYEILYKRDINQNIPTKSILLTDVIGVDMPLLAKNLGVEIRTA